ncbi:uncharacterized protein LOC133866932 isoform X2 [Alnus glutinosa]|uniref:uncharacterized protein LOC133866932 isoform X2 n=1 Tax=Alnus glutinosa TaxID=3517 RepID=UPI002D779A3B|nr:uncharacterized protein LOC133866932 isoform X2 [Alnus glutinosa]
MHKHVTICQKCGDNGWDVALIYCDNCQVYAEHRYCLDVLPNTFHEYVTWFCVDCEPKVGKKLSTIDKATFLPSAISHPINSKNVQATQSRIGFKKKICSQRLKNSKKVKKKKIKVTTDSLAKATMEICENRPSLQLNETHCGKIFEKDQKLGQDLRLVLTDDTNSNDEVGYLNHSLQLCEMHCGENCEGQKLGQEAGVDLKDGANLEEVAESVTPSLRCSEMRNDENCEKLQKLRLDLKDKTNADVEAESVKTSHIAMRDPSNILEHKCHVRSQPIIDRIWRGSLSICNKRFGTVGLVAHLSNLACPKVFEEAKLIPGLLSAELLCRSGVWPKGFGERGPTDQSIALYFFPENESDEKAFQILVDSMIGQDLALRSVVQNAELLVFSSKLLPPKYWRFQAKFYLWGVFRKKQAVCVKNAAVCEVEENLTGAKTWDRRAPVRPLSNSGSYGSSSLYSIRAPVF